MENNDNKPLKPNDNGGKENNSNKINESTRTYSDLGDSQAHQDNIQKAFEVTPRPPKPKGEDHKK